MEGSQNGFGSCFSPANFTDAQDTSNGLDREFSGSTDFVSMSLAMENLSVATMNLIQEELVNKNMPNNDENSRTKKSYSNIKNRIVMIGAAGHLAQIETFLKPVLEGEAYKKIKDLAATLNRDNFNGFSNDFFKDIDIDISGAAFFTDDIGMDLSTFRDALKKVNAEYDTAYFNLFESDDQLCKSISKFTKLTEQIDNLLALDINDASLDVYESFNKYMSVFFKDQKIKERFDAFIIARKKFVVYRDIVLTCQRAVKRTDEPTECSPCVICMENPVKTAFVPCGHTFCLQCSNKNLTTCYICRTKITSRLKLYFN
jgi:hypothetical protein